MMKTETLLIILISMSFLGFVAGLAGKNSFHTRKKTLRWEKVFDRLTAVSIIMLLLLAVIYNILYV